MSVVPVPAFILAAPIHLHVDDVVGEIVAALVIAATLALAKFLWSTSKTLSIIKSEFVTNGGSTLRDQTDRIETKVTVMASQQESIDKRVTRLETFHDGHTELN